MKITYLNDGKITVTWADGSIDKFDEASWSDYYSALLLKAFEEGKKHISNVHN